MAKRATGFTLMELLIVVVIIATLASILIPVFFNLQKRQAHNACMTNLREIGVALAMYREDHGSFPPGPAAGYLKAWRPTSDGGGNAEALAYMPVAEMPLAVQHATAPPTDASSEVEVRGAYALDRPHRFMVHVVDNTADPNTVAWSADDGATWNGPIAITSDYSALTFADGTASGLEFRMRRATGNADPATDASRYHIWGVKTAGNFGLYSLYYLYLQDRKDYLRGYRGLHCPAMRDTESVNRGEYLRQLAPPATGPTRVDPLMSGFNTYDVMYNYDQYAEAIADFDIALSGAKSDDPDNSEFYTPNAALHSPRQLRNAGAPADTVVTVCYAHRLEAGPHYRKIATRDIDPVTLKPRRTLYPAFTAPSTATEAELQQQRRQLEQGARNDLLIVLWRDGSVDYARPHIVRGADDPASGERRFYWQPPFLYTRGGRE